MHPLQARSGWAFRGKFHFELASREIDIGSNLCRGARAIQQLEGRPQMSGGIAESVSSASCFDFHESPPLITSNHAATCR